MKYLILAACAGLSLAWTTSARAEPHFAGVCNSCSTPAEFKSFAFGLVSSYAAGSWEIEVFNESTEILYIVNANKENDPAGPIEYGVALRASALKEDATVELAKFLRTQEHVLIMPVGTIYSSFSQAQDWDVCSYGSAVYSSFNPASGVMGRAIQTLLGTQPALIAIFNNGDVAKYKLTDVRGGALSCQYEEGTARTSTGEVIDDGSGDVTDSDYVSPAVPGVFIVRVREGTWGYRYRSCGRVGNGPWTCEEYNE
ncbi:hypothetical protein [Chiayiivirga flava]|uniref:Uncharacterized protein n=1 Tax=Chiayiivirga flava TaxID=659595 RepID=A0A7W8D346_9GAMM|nr:hypothetical protein [Chiayiivirga flava]MBB5207073.1 hypothetical protein [Chiayiivirga flava]